MRYPFIGWDYMELADKWGVFLPDFEDSSPYYLADYDYIKLYLDEFVFKFNMKGRGDRLTRVGRAAARDIREYCAVLADGYHGYAGAVWKAISEIEDDYTTLQIFLPLLGHAWD
jgi:hypothetical protein